MLNTAHLYFSERGLDLDCTDVFFKTARISVPAPNKVRISYDYYKHKFVEDMQMYVAGCLYKSTGLKVAIAGSFIIGSLIVGPFSTMKAICDGFSCVSFVYFAFTSICISIFLFFMAGNF